MASRTSRAILNRKTIDGITLAIADGAFEVAKAHQAATNAPDAPPYGRGLLQGGGAMVWANGKKVDGTTIGGRQITKPRRLNVKDYAVVAVSGWGFPARFVQFGTARQRAQAFFLMSTIEGRAASIMRRTAAYRIARLR